MRSGALAAGSVSWINLSDGRSPGRCPSAAADSSGLVVVQVVRARLGGAPPDLATTNRYDCDGRTDWRRNRATTKKPFENATKGDRQHTELRTIKSEQQSAPRVSHGAHSGRSGSRKMNSPTPGVAEWAGA